MKQLYERHSTASTPERLDAAIRAAIGDHAAAHQLGDVLGQAQAVCETHSVRLYRNGLIARITGSADPDREHRTVAVLTPATWSSPCPATNGEPTFARHGLRRSAPVPASSGCPTSESMSSGTGPARPTSRRTPGSTSVSALTRAGRISPTGCAPPSPRPKPADLGFRRSRGAPTEHDATAARVEPSRPVPQCGPGWPVSGYAGMSTRVRYHRNRRSTR